MLLRITEPRFRDRQRSLTGQRGPDRLQQGLVEPAKCEIGIFTIYGDLSDSLQIERSTNPQAGKRFGEREPSLLFIDFILQGGHGEEQAEFRMEHTLGLDQ